MPFSLITKTPTEFTSTWNSPTDSGNYKLHWAATQTSSAMLKSGVSIITNGATSLTVPFSFPALASGDYSVIPRFSNVVDGSPIHQPIVITNKSLTDFTAKWNQPVDSGNYKLEWILKTL